MCRLPDTTPPACARCPWPLDCGACQYVRLPNGEYAYGKGPRSKLPGAQRADEWAILQKLRHGAA